jgi:LPS-assembly protein
VTFAGVPWLSQSQSSFFGKSEQVPVFLTDQPISDSDFYSGRGIQFDYYDRVTERNSVTFSLNNRLVRKRFIDGAADYRQIASFRLSQSYDFDEAQRPSSGQHFPWSGISGLLDVRLDNFETNTLVRYFPYHNVVNTSSRATIKDARGDYFQLNFAQTYLITEKPEEAYPGRTENVGFEAGFDTRYLTFAGALAYQPTDWSRLNFVVKSWSALMTIKPPGNCWGIRATIRQDIGAALMYKLNFDFKFGGEKS